MSEENKTNKIFHVKIPEWLNNFFSKTITKAYSIAIIVNCCIFFVIKYLQQKQFYYDFMGLVTIFLVFVGTLLTSIIFSIVSCHFANKNLQQGKSYKRIFLLYLSLLLISQICFFSLLSIFDDESLIKVIITVSVCPVFIYCFAFLLVFLHDVNDQLKAKKKLVFFQDEKIINFTQRKNRLIKIFKENKIKISVIGLVFTVILVTSYTIINKDKPTFLNYGKWIVVDDEMSTKRDFATANLLPDGNVLIMGGTGSKNADIYDSKNNRIIKASQNNYSYGYTTTPLKNGDIFIFGGTGIFRDDNEFVHIEKSKTPKIFRSKEYKFYDTNSPKIDPSSYYDFSTTLLKNGNVLIIPTDKDCSYSLVKYQVYNPQTNSYYYTNNRPQGRVNKNILKDKEGNIYIIGIGTHKYDENKNMFTTDSVPQYSITGWKYCQIDSDSILSITPTKNYTYGFLYDINSQKEYPVKNKIHQTFRLENNISLVPLRSGKVLILGINKKDWNETQKNIKYTAYIYDKNKNMFFKIQTPPYPVFEAGICELENGDILVAGGYTRKLELISNKIQILKIHQKRR